MFSDICVIVYVEEYKIDADDNIRAKKIETIEISFFIVNYRL